MSAPSNVIDAFVDTGWHLVVQPSVFASLFAIVVFVFAGFATAILMVLPKFTWHPFVGAMVYCCGTVAIACVVGWGLQMLMEGGLYLFGRVTQLAGLCCGGAGVLLVGYNLAVKTVEVRIHEGIDHVIPHGAALGGWNVPSQMNPFASGPHTGCSVGWRIAITYGRTR